MADWYPYDRHTPGDGDDRRTLEEECIHEGVECEYNVNESGDPTCPCRCDDCGLTEFATDDEYDAPYRELTDDEAAAEDATWD